MKSGLKLNLDSYFKFLKDYFELFNFTEVKRKKIVGKQFKL